MHYILMHKDIQVALLDVDKNTSVVLNILDIFNKAHYPVGVPTTDVKKLNSWVQNRVIPASREHLSELLISTDSPNVTELSLRFYGLSLTDQYWFNPVDNPQKWRDINFFDNEFSEDVGDYLVGNIYTGDNLNIRTPDCATNGVLTKRWKIVNGDRVLFKAGRGIIKQEVFNELIATELMKRLNIDHAEYNFIQENNKVYCVSKNFVTRDTEFVSAWYVTGADSLINTMQFYNKYVEVCEQLKIPHAFDMLDKMLLIDYLLLNTDRHINNFGFIRNANTLEWLGFAPIFDTGTSLNCDNDVSDTAILKPFGSTEDQQLAIINSFNWLDANALNNFDLYLRSILTDCYLRALASAERVNLIITAYLYRRNKLLEHILPKVEYAIDISPYVKDLVKQALAQYKVDADYRWFELHTKQEAMELIGTLS